MNPALPTRPKAKNLFILGVSGALATLIWLHPRVRAQEMPTPAEMSPVSAPATSRPTPTPLPDPEQISFIISPPRAELTGKPGETLQVTLKVKNVTDRTQTFRSSAVDYIVGPDGKTPQEVGENMSSRWSAEQWISLSPESLRIPANSSQTIQALIQIPQDALPGGRYAMVLHSPVAETAQKEKSVSAIEARSGTLLYLTVAGDIREEAFVQNLKAPRWVENGPVQISYDIDNQSDIHITPQTKVTVRDLFGRVMTENRVPPQNIFPYLSRNFQTTYDSFWGFGPYTATIEAAYGNSGKIAKGMIQFWMFPYRLLLAVFVGLSSALAILIAIRRHILHRNNVQTQQIEILEERIRELEGRNQERKRRG